MATDQEGNRSWVRRSVIFALVTVLSALPGALLLMGVGFESGAGAYSDQLMSAIGGESLDSLDYAMVQGATAYTLLEWTVVVLAMATAIMAFVHYHVRRGAMSVLVATAAFWVSVVTAFQLLAFHGFTMEVENLGDFVMFNWTASQTFLALLLLGIASVVLWRGNQEKFIDIHHVVGLVVASSVLAYAIIFSTAHASQLPAVLWPDRWVSRPIELVPMLLFFMAGAVVLPRLHKLCRSSFSMALWVSTIPLMASQFYMAVPSVELFDAGFTGAQLTRAMAFAVIFGGLGWDYATVCQSETRLRRQVSTSDRRIRMLFNNAIEAIVIFDSQWKVKTWNRRATEIFGWTAQEARNEDVFEVLFGDDGQDSYQIHRLRHRLDTFVSSGESEELKQLQEFVKERHSGADMFIEYSVVPLRERQQTTFALLARDVSQRKQLETRMAQMDRLIAVGTLAAGVVHEIKNPLTYMLSNVELATEGVEELHKRCSDFDGSTQELIQETTEALDASTEGGERIAQIVSDIRLFSRHRPHHKRPVSVLDALETALRMSRAEVERRARIERNFRPVPTIDGDETRLSQVFINLAVNAAQAMEEESAGDNILFVETDCVEDRVVIRFRDTGPGMSDTVRAQIFQPFFTTKSAENGTGLGLTLSKSIIEEFGGELEVRSVPGQGTTIEIWLPVSERDDDNQRLSGEEE